MYEIGDKIVVNGWKHTGSREIDGIAFIHEMDKFIGQESTIISIETYFGIYPVYCLDKVMDDKKLHHWKFVDQWIEPVEESIEINIDDKDFEAILV